VIVRRDRLRLAANRAALFFRPLVSSPLLPLCVLAGFLFLFQLGRRDLTSSHEARAAQNAQRMLDTGEWGLPVLFDGQVDLQKPPAYYWLVAAAGWLSGGVVDAWVARLPAALAGLGAVLLVYLFLRRDGRPVAAIVAALGLATAAHFTAITRTARIDVPLTAAVTASLLAFYRGCESGAKRRLLWHLVAAVAAAAAVLLKGPVGLALIGTTAVVWLTVEWFRASGDREVAGYHMPTGDREVAARQRPALPLSSVVLGTFVLVALALPWFVWADRATDGEFARVFFWHHTVARFAGTSPTLASYPWWYYLPRFAVDFLPWTPALVLLVAWAVRSGRWRRDRLLRFGLVWFAVMFAVLSAAKFKRSDYLLPLFPGAAIALGCAAEEWLATRSQPRTVRSAKWAFGLVVAAVVVGWQVMTFVVEPREEARQEKRGFAAVVRVHAPPPARVLLFRAESHLLAFHLGPPLRTLVEWGELNDLLAEPGPHVVVIPPEYVYPAGKIITARRLEVVARLGDYTAAPPPRPLVLLRTVD
jgi:4-amino-4-deoxy-L-arabinose transferase-like glycosyltransferase